MWFKFLREILNIHIKKLILEFHSSQKILFASYLYLSVGLSQSSFSKMYQLETLNFALLYLYRSLYKSYYFILKRCLILLVQHIFLPLFAFSTWSAIVWRNTFIELFYRNVLKVFYNILAFSYSIYSIDFYLVFSYFYFQSL